MSIGRWSARARRGNRAQHNPLLERLEGRTLYSATFDPASRALEITGTESRDVITVRRGLDGQAYVTAPGVDRDTIFNGVRSISITALGGSDTVRIFPGLRNADRERIDIHIDGGDGRDRLIGGDGDDTLIGGAGRDRITDQRGDNLIAAGSGRDVIRTGNGDDRIDAGDDADFIIDRGGTNTIDTGAGNNRVRLIGSGNHYLMLGSGNDHVTGRGNAPIILDRGGRNVIKLKGNADHTIFTDRGSNTINVAGKNLTLVARDGDHTVRSRAWDRNVLITGDGDDRLLAKGGMNRIDAGAGRNRIVSGHGADALQAGNGNDTIIDRGGLNHIDAGLGRNRIDGTSDAQCPTLDFDDARVQRDALAQKLDTPSDLPPEVTQRLRKLADDLKSVFNNPDAAMPFGFDAAIAGLLTPLNNQLDMAMGLPVSAPQIALIDNLGIQIAAVVSPFVVENAGAAVKTAPAYSTPRV